jgi:dipeptidyl aminopeptidase/acylaminoacyl peptidase
MIMKNAGRLNILIAIISATFLFSCSKDSTYSRNITTPSDDKFTDITYGANINWLGQNEDLKLDVYLPPTRTEGAKYPLLVWIHGGGFLTGDKATSDKFCSQFAEEGFVVSSINYRIGWTKSGTNPCDGDTTEAKEAYYRAVQDARAAIRYLVANAGQYAVDTNWIFIGGASAGGVTSLSLPYLTDALASAYLGSDITSKLGSLNASNTLTNAYNIKGVLSMWGAIGDPKMITPQNAVPTIFFQGTDDNVTPFNIDPFYMCPNFMIGYGTKPLYERLTGFGTPAVAHIEPGGGHGVFTDEFRVANSVCFMKSLMTKKPERGYYTDEEYSCE